MRDGSNPKANAKTALAVFDLGVFDLGVAKVLKKAFKINQGLRGRYVIDKNGYAHIKTASLHRHENGLRRRSWPDFREEYVVSFLLFVFLLKCFRGLRRISVSGNNDCALRGCILRPYHGSNFR